VDGDRLDESLRAAAAAYVQQLLSDGSDRVLSRDLVRFEFQGRRVPLVEQRGIRHVRGFEAAISIRTTFSRRAEDRPYEDIVGEDGYLRYKWRGTDMNIADNVSLRRAMELGKQLIWSYGVGPGTYVPVAPVWLVDEEPEHQQFVVALDQLSRSDWMPGTLQHPADLALRRQYVEALVKRRLHQRVFRQHVLSAYRSRCALCRLQLPELLEAAHIKEDADGGEPIVTNGVAMCAIHHRAFDAQVLGIRPDYVLEIRADVLRQHDGPTLQHALQGLHHERLTIPRRMDSRPDSELLEERFERFRAAG
jgi:putative restriction endonuclease